MSEWITAGEFHQAEGVQDWRVLANGVSAHFRTGSFATGVEFVGAIGAIGAIGALADTANQPPEVDLRSSGATVRLIADEVHGLSRRYPELARQISAAAQGLGVAADPAAVQDVQVTVDALIVSEVRAFWRAVLGYREVGEEDLLDPHSRGPSFWFQQMHAPRPQRNRIHVDIFVPHDRAEARVAAAIAAGGHLVTDEHAPAWWVLADTEGNEACVASWMGRD